MIIEMWYLTLLCGTLLTTGCLQNLLDMRKGLVHTKLFYKANALAFILAAGWTGASIVAIVYLQFIA